MARQERGELARGEGDQGRLGREHMFETNDGKRSFAAGDRIVFLENNRELGVKNGMLGTVASVEEGRIAATLDGKGRNGEDRLVTVSTDSYGAIDHGYATQRSTKPKGRPSIGHSSWRRGRWTGI